VDFLFEADTIHQYTGSGTDWAWTATSINPVIVGNNVEVIIPRSILNSNAMDIFFYANNEAIGGTAQDFYPDGAGDRLAPFAERAFTYLTDPTTPIEPPPTPAPASIFVDGNLSDWPENSVLGETDADDMAPPAIIDWKSLHVTNNESTVYVAYESYDPIQLSWGYGVLFDTDNNPATGFRGFSSELPIGAEFILEANELNRYTGATQTEWSWESEGTQQLVTNGNIAEVAIPRSILGNPVAMNLMLKGENAANNGVGVDLHPDTGALEYTLTDNIQNDEPVAAAATNQVTGGNSGGGSFGLLGLIVTFLLARCRRHRVMAFATCTVLLTACGGGSNTVINGGNNSDNQPTENAPTNNPSFASLPTATQPSADASFKESITVNLDGQQVVPAVATSSTASASITINRHTGELRGSVLHGIADASDAAIYHGKPGSNGAALIVMGSPDSNVFSIPAGTRLTPQQLNHFDLGELYVLIRSDQHGKGIVRAQLSAR